MLDSTTVGAACALTILKADRSAVKQFVKRADGRYDKVSDYDLGFLFRADPYQVDNLDDLFGIVDEIRSRGDMVMVRGELDDAYYEEKKRNPNYRITRRKNDKHDGFTPHLTEVPRRWAMLDIDDYPLPPDADLAVDPVGITDAVIRNILPEQFHNARCFFQLSNSAGLVPGIYKGHIFFWLDTAWENAALRKWFKVNAPHIDHAPFSANQPHYICDPIIKDADGQCVTDPLPNRLGWRPGAHDVVSLPPLVETQKPARKRSQSHIGRSATPGLYAASIDECLTRLGDGQGLDGFHAVLLACGMQYALRVARGAERDDEAYIARLNEAIEAAPGREDRHDISKYLEQGYHDRLIDGAFNLVANTQETHQKNGVEFPAGFGMTHAGLYYTPPPDKDGNQPDAIWVCAAFNVVGQCASNEGEQWGVVLEWSDGCGCDHRWIVDRALLHGEASVVCAQLEDKGLRCNTKAQNPLKACLALLRPDRHLTAVERGGWQTNAFILPNGETIGGSAVFMRSEIAKRDLGSAQQGSLAEWNHHIGRYCVGNSRLGLFVSTAFAGPLLDIINEPSGGVHLFGESQKGKTTAVYVAASVWGKGSQDGKVQQWRSTANGLEGVAARANDGFLAMDEISQSEAREAGETSYSLANGQGKQRADRYGSARPRQHWRLMFISTGEMTLSQRMAEAHRQAMTGMEVRLIDIRMDGGKGMGLFEHLHGYQQAGAMSDHLRDASATYYGTPIRAFLERLVAMRSDDPDGLADYVRSYRELFITNHVPKGADGQVRSVAGRLGVIAAAGEMAITMGVLDWPDGEAERACIRCFGDWLGARGTIGSGEAQKGTQQVRRFLELHGNSRFLEILPGYAPQMGQAREDRVNDYAHPYNQAGYKRYDSEAKQWIFMFTPEVWKSEVCAGLDSEQVAKALDEKDWLERAGGHYTKQVRIPKLEKKLRLYVVSGDILAS